MPSVESSGRKRGTVPVVANGGFGDTTGTVPFGEERQDIPTLGWASISRISISR